MEVSLVSGGINSTLGYYLFAENSLPIHVSYPCESQLEQHIACSKLFGTKLNTFTLISNCISKDDASTCKKSLMFASICVAFIKDVSKINIFTSSDVLGIDDGLSLSESMREVLSLFANRDIAVSFPTIAYTKKDIVSEAKNFLSQNFDSIIKKIFSCDCPKNLRHCNSCITCVRRELALFGAGINTVDMLSDEILNSLLKKTDISDGMKSEIKRYVYEKKGLQF